MKFNYTKVSDFFIPLLKIKNIKQKNIGKYGRMRLEYIKNCNKVLYTNLLMNGTLNSYLCDIDNKCKKDLDILIPHFKVKENITEELKERDSLEWVAQMSNIKNRAEEIIMKEYIFE